MLGVYICLMLSPLNITDKCCVKIIGETIEYEKKTCIKFEFKRVFFPQHLSVILSDEKASGCCYATEELDKVIRGLLPLMQEKCLDLINKWTEKFGVK